MKKFLIVIAVVLFSVSPVMAETPFLEKDTNSNIKIDLTKKTEYVEVKTVAATYRIYPSGKVEKLEWEIIERGKDRDIYWYGVGSVTLEATEEMQIK